MAKEKIGVLVPGNSQCGMIGGEDIIVLHGATAVHLFYQLIAGDVYRPRQKKWLRTPY